MLCAPVFIFTSSSSALLGLPRCGLSIWLSLLQFFSRENEQNLNILEVHHSRMIRKWSPTFTRRAKHQCLESFCKNTAVGRLRQEPITFTYQTDRFSGPRGHPHYMCYLRHHSPYHSECFHEGNIALVAVWQTVRLSHEPISSNSKLGFSPVEQLRAVFTRDTFTWGKCISQ